MKNQTTQPIAVCESNAVDSEKKSKKRWFTLTRQNQKGQVAIFVALIFQVIFVFFALLINVGLLVHHKINLQQSTDLAAYYGAMKQAEMLNVIGHVNFQIRQAWKLLTWRYRILGTFGSQNNNGSLNPMNFPIQNLLGPTRYDSTDTKCPSGIAQGFNLNDVPAFCMSHAGYADWPAPAGGSETYCKIDCGTLSTGLSNTVNSISGVGTFAWGSATTGVAIGSAISAANANIADKCTKSTVMTAGVLSKFIYSYLEDIKNKKKAVALLLSNLSNSESNFVDLNGQLVSTGALNTLKNNLTEANLKSLSSSTKVLNGLSDDFSAGAGCTYSMGSSSSSDLVAEIAFKYIIFYQLACDGSDGTKTFKFVPIVDAASGLNSIIRQQLVAGGVNPADIEGVFSQDNGFSIGFEKNPWCMSYYGVRATAEPKIPFLPISKVKLSAVSIAKPFGGSIGPKFYDTWDASESATQRVNGDQNRQVDKMLPLRNAQGVAASLVNTKKVALNFSNYVGDAKGLSDHEYIAAYHDFLIASNQLGEGGTNRPAFAKWEHIIEDMHTSNTYDPLSNDISASNSVRNLEISVVAPNQFDLTYYSIDPDFYNNYYLNKLDNNTNSYGKKVIDEIKSKVAGAPTTPISFLPDYGYNKATSLKFNVLDQLKTVEQIVRAATTFATPSINKSFNIIPKSPASLLTGWTFMNMTNEAGYTTFPSDGTRTSMQFGKCADANPANAEYKSITEYNGPGGGALPPTPGNCITGGRTGYSVKIVSQEAINGQQGAIGGQGTSGPIRNPIPPSFLNF